MSWLQLRGLDEVSHVVDDINNQTKIIGTWVSKA